MSIFWEGFWFLLFTLSNANGHFLVFSAIFTTPWSRFLATIMSTTLFRGVFKNKYVFEPICLDFASILLLQSIITSYGMKRAHMMALCLNTLPFFIGYLVPRPNPAREWRWTALLLIYCNIEWMMMILFIAHVQKEGEDDRYGKIFWVGLGWLLIAQSLHFGYLHLRLKRKRIVQNMAARIMSAQIAGLGRIIPLSRRHAL